MTNKYYPPIHKADSFHCPLCNVYAKQLWGRIIITGNYSLPSWLSDVETFSVSLSENNFSASKCTHCGQILIWANDKIVFPKANSIQLPNDDLSEEVKKDYLEASNIINESPRAAAALLRLSLQKLCKNLGEKGDNINEDIKNMVAKGLNPLIQKALDSIRITGNNAVHPGEIDLDEDKVKVYRMFELINFIGQKMISEPKEIEKFYSELPTDSINAVNKRDKK